MRIEKTLEDWEEINYDIYKENEFIGSICIYKENLVPGDKLEIKIEIDEQRKAN